MSSPSADHSGSEVTSTHRVKISDFGVSYLGRPMRDEEEEQVGETDGATKRRPRQ
jgi:hypothetical protein